MLYETIVEFYTISLFLVYIFKSLKKFVEKFLVIFTPNSTIYHIFRLDRCQSDVRHQIFYTEQIVEEIMRDSDSKSTEISD